MARRRRRESAVRVRRMRVLTGGSLPSGSRALLLVERNAVQSRAYTLTAGIAVSRWKCSFRPGFEFGQAAAGLAFVGEDDADLRS